MILDCTRSALHHESSFSWRKGDDDDKSLYVHRVLQGTRSRRYQTSLEDIWYLLVRLPLHFRLYRKSTIFMWGHQWSNEENHWWLFSRTYSLLSIGLLLYSLYKINSIYISWPWNLRFLISRFSLNVDGRTDIILVIEKLKKAEIHILIFL